MKKTALLRLSVAATVAAGAALALSGCGPSNQTEARPDQVETASAEDFEAPGPKDKGGEDNPIKIGVMGPEIHYDVLERDAAELGIHVEWVEFSDYQQPNPSTVQGETDLNQFQHILFLAQYNVESGERLVPLAATAVYPLSVFSEKHASVDEIPAGAKVAIPNDETNQARAIAVLAQNGLVTLKDGTEPLYATPADVVEDKSKVEVVPVSAEQTPRALEDPEIAAAVINQNYSLDAGLNPQDALASDDPNAPGSAPFINVWAGPAGLLGDPVFVKLFELTQQQDFADALVEQSGGSGVIVHRAASDLTAVLDDVEAQLRAHQ
ncbi:MAG: ABC transporter substrate-binding protein [Bifidobacteriaceae bacterium]|jgi:D-methionine transport system substrate-binding protein|nr:ABC transporter substrate-binding protein [Bifidobacteriaceae bacterium]